MKINLLCAGRARSKRAYAEGDGQSLQSATGGEGSKIAKFLHTYVRTMDHPLLCDYKGEVERSVFHPENTQ